MTMTLRHMSHARHYRRPLDDEAFHAAMTTACRELHAEGKFPSYKNLRTKGLFGSNSRILRARGEVMVELELAYPHAKARAAAAHRVYIEGLKRKPKPEVRPKQSTPPPTPEAAACWELRKAFWVTTTGKRTRQLLLRPSHQETRS